MCGIDSVFYWDMTYGEIIAAIKGSQQKAKTDMQFQAAMAYKLGELIGIAYNEPKKYPGSVAEAFPKLFDDTKEPIKQDWQIMKERMQTYAKLRKKRGENL